MRTLMPQAEQDLVRKEVLHDELHQEEILHINAALLALEHATSLEQVSWLNRVHNDHKNHKQALIHQIEKVAKAHLHSHTSFHGTGFGSWPNMLYCYKLEKKRSCLSRRSGARQNALL